MPTPATRRRSPARASAVSPSRCSLPAPRAGVDPPAAVRIHAPMTAPAPRVVLRQGRDARVRAGHLWVYASEIGTTAGDPEPGSAVDVVDPRGRFLGRGHWNPASTISVRILTRRRDEALDAAFLRRRIAQAVAYRRQF